jgi:hypothetical protein
MMPGTLHDFCALGVWFVEWNEAPNRNGQKPYPAKMRRLRFLCFEESLTKWIARQIQDLLRKISM